MLYEPIFIRLKEHGSCKSCRRIIYPCYKYCRECQIKKNIPNIPQPNLTIKQGE